MDGEQVNQDVELALAQATKTLELARQISVSLYDLSGHLWRSHRPFAATSRCFFPRPF